jgi:hypothetical protein
MWPARMCGGPFFCLEDSMLATRHKPTLAPNFRSPSLKNLSDSEKYREDCDLS